MSMFLEPVPAGIVVLSVSVFLVVWSVCL